MAIERLQKILAAAGVASRRAAEDLITQGRVRVDGRVVTELGFKADARKQRIELDGRLLTAEDLVYVLLHKPKGVVCTLSDPEGRPTVVDYLKGVQGRVVPVGRLDFHTSGVLLCTNDGDFAAALTHPKKQCEKTYVAKVQGVLDDEGVEQWRRPIEIDGKRTRPAEVKKLRVEGDKTWLEITLHEGKNRQIHRIGEAVGNKVLRLARVAFAGITAEGVRPGYWRYLSVDELRALKKVHGVPKRVRPAPPLPNQREIRKARATGKSRPGPASAQGNRSGTKKSAVKKAPLGKSATRKPTANRQAATKTGATKSARRSGGSKKAGRR